MIPQSSQIDAIVLFGSSARKDTDLYSDRDIFLVGNDRTALSQYATSLETLGWACTHYTWSQLQKAVDRGAMFVQHLKQEAIILKDRENHFRATLSRFSPKPDYSYELAEATKLFGILETIPNSIPGRFWALDVLMVSFRTLSISFLANEGIYQFSFQGILNDLRRIGMVCNQDIADLQELRKYKWMYRSRQWHDIPSWPQVLHLVDLVNRKYRIGIDLKCASNWQVVDNALREHSVYTRNWYINCRRLEVSLWSLIPANNSVKDEAVALKRRLLGLIKSPNQYGWLFVSQWADLQQELKTLASMCVEANTNDAYLKHSLTQPRMGLTEDDKKKSVSV